MYLLNRLYVFRKLYEWRVHKFIFSKRSECFEKIIVEQCVTECNFYRILSQRRKQSPFLEISRSKT